MLQAPCCKLSNAKQGPVVTDRFRLRGKVCCILVGNAPTPAEYHVHETLLKSKSKFFDAALNKCWMEGREGRVLLPEDDPEIFEVYQNYIYTKVLPVKVPNPDLKLEGNENHPEYFTLAKLYAFGEKVQDVSFKNAVMKAFLGRMGEPVGSVGKWNPITKVVDIIYGATMPDSRARQLMVDVHVNLGASHWITTDLEENNKEFLMDLSRALLKGRTRSGWTPVQSDYLETE